jgi:hypothetical protein
MEIGCHSDLPIAHIVTPFVAAFFIRYLSCITEGLLHIRQFRLHYIWHFMLERLTLSKLAEIDTLPPDAASPLYSSVAWLSVICLCDCR